MDPDRSCLVICLILFVLLLHRSLYLLGRDAPESETARLGFDAAFGGKLACCLISGLCCGVFGLWALAPLWPFGPAVLLVLLPASGIYALAFGRARQDSSSPAWEESLFKLLGRLFCLPAQGIFRALKLSAASPVTEEDILDLVEDVEDDRIDESQKDMICAVFELDDIEVSEIMTHRTEVEAIEDTTPAAEVIRDALETGFSRMPVYRKNLDNVVGVLHVKDLLRLSDDPDAAKTAVARLMRPAMYIPESCRARELLLQFKEKHTQMAVVVDEYGGTAGLVTMEDILEEIVGNIQDEFDKDDEDFRPVKDGVVCKGSADLEELFDQFDLPMPDRTPDEDFDSVGGLILQRLGRFPTPEEEICIDWGGVTFRVLACGDRRIERVLCRMIQQEETPNET